MDNTQLYTEILQRNKKCYPILPAWELCVKRKQRVS